MATKPKEVTPVVKPTSAVIYTDGGCRPNPGNPGWGCHGYIFDINVPTKSTGLPSQIITAKGYVAANPLSKAEFKNVTVHEYIDYFGSSLLTQSNNTAEVEAAINGLECLYNKGIRDINLLTDSQYVKKGLEEWVPIWVSKNWIRQDGRPVPNSAEWKRLIAITDLIKADGGTITITWVKAHNGDHGNTKADLLATLGVTHSMDNKAVNDLKLSEPEGYWKHNNDIHPFLCFTRMFFNSVIQYHVPGHYNLAKPVKDNFLIGKKTPDTAYSIVKLKEPEPVLELVIKKQCDVANDINSLIVARLDNIFYPEIYSNILERKGYAMLQQSRANLGLAFLDNSPLTSELNPVGIGYRVLDEIAILEELYDKYMLVKSGKTLPENDTFKAHDVTEEFYILTGKTPKLKPSFISGFKDMVITLNVMSAELSKEIKVPLSLGLDLPTRNDLKNIETKNPRIYILTWSLSTASLNYACLIETNDALGIWSNAFSNTIITAKKKVS